MHFKLCELKLRLWLTECPAYMILENKKVYKIYAVEFEYIEVEGDDKNYRKIPGIQVESTAAEVNEEKNHLQLFSSIPYHIYLCKYVLYTYY